MIRKTLLVVLCITTLFASVASAQFTISRSGRWVTGTVSGVSGTNVLLFDNRLSIDLASAEIRSKYGPATIADLTPGTRIRAGVYYSEFMATVYGVEVDILPDHEASIEAQITRIDFAAGTFDILGKTVRLTGNTKVYRTNDGALVPVSDLRPLMIVLLELDRDETGLAAKTIAFAPGQANLTTTTGGRLHGIDGDRWTIGGVTVRVTPDTFIGGDPRVGDRVRVSYRGDAAGDLVAVIVLRITSLGEEDIAGEVKVLNGRVITIDTSKGSTTLRLDDSTEYRGQPEIGSLVRATEKDGVASSVELIFATDYTFAFGGTIDSIEGNEWTVQGVTFSVHPDTRVTGSPQLGDRVDVDAMDIHGRWYAMTVDKLSFAP